MNFIDEIGKRSIKPVGLIHVGAHTCLEFRDYLAMSLDSVMLFEPLEDVFQGLRDNVNASLRDCLNGRFPNTILVNKALGSEVSRKEMWVEDTNPFGAGMSSSLLEPKLHTEQYPDIVFDKRRQVDVSTLDEELMGSRLLYNILNIDVQGYELEVLKGASEALKNIEIIFIEVNAREMYKGCVLVGELDRFLEKHGFKREETVWQYHNGQETWGDAIYVSHSVTDRRLSNLEKNGEIQEFCLLDKRIFQNLKRLNYYPKVIYDVGASNGSWSAEIAKIFPESRYHLFEPLVDHSEEYSRPMHSHLASNGNFQLHKVALGEKTESRGMRMFTDSIFGSSTLRSFEYEQSKEIPVEFWSLDDLIEKFSLPVPALLKMDTQGSELQILKGMAGNIRNVDILLIETWLVRGYGQETPLMNEMIEWLGGFGFRVFDFAGEYRDKGLLCTIDTVFINTNRLSF